MAKTTIEWTDATWNPVTGCTKVSAGCQNCYMFRQWPRLQGMGVPGYEGPPSQPVCHPERLLEPCSWRRPRRIFVCSMSDLFHSAVPFSFIAQVFQTMVDCPQHTFQVLTKRPGRLLHFVRHVWPGDALPPNVWVGTSLEMMEDGRRNLAGRVDLLCQVPAAIHFVSAEPLLGLLDLTPWLGNGLESLDWVIAGGESGPGARPMKATWVQGLRDQCIEAKVPFFFKQAIIANKKVALPELDGRQWKEFPLAK